MSNDCRGTCNLDQGKAKEGDENSCSAFHTALLIKVNVKECPCYVDIVLFIICLAYGRCIDNSLLLSALHNVPETVLKAKRRKFPHLSDI